MIYYFDASALVKRYVAEKGSDRVNELLNQGLPATSRLSVVEITSALARRWRQGDLKKDKLNEAISILNEDSEKFLLIELTPAVAQVAAKLLLSHRLRAGDAIQLGSCVYLKERTENAITFIGYDENLNETARRLDLLVP